MNEPKICPTGGMQGGQVTEHWDSSSTQGARKEISLYVYQFYFFMCIHACCLQRPEEVFPSPETSCEQLHGAGN